MKTIGMIGGVSWESSKEYYNIINQEVRKRLGGFHSAKSLMYSLDFGPASQLQHEERWDELSKIFIEIGRNLELCGAELLIICSNTMNKMADDVEKNVSIPLIHIVDPTAEVIKSNCINDVGLLGTKFTMEQDYSKGRYIKKHGLNVIIPDNNDRQIVHDIIYDELCLGKILDSSREEYKRIILKLAEKGAEAVILGCTEIPLLIKQNDSDIMLLDTTELHAKAAVDFALS